MSWQSMCRVILTADQGATPTHVQKFRVPAAARNCVLAGMQAGIFLYDDPAFTAVSMEIWTDNNGSPCRLLASSTTSYAKAALLEVEDSAYRLLGFAFPRIPLKAGMYYHAAIRITGYTGDQTTFIAWRMTWPDPPYVTGLTLTTEKGAISPFELLVFTDTGE